MSQTSNGCHLCGERGERLLLQPYSITSESKLLPQASSLWRCLHCGHVYTRTALNFSEYYAQQYDATLTDEGMDEIVSTVDGTITFRTDLDYRLFRRHLDGYVSSSDRLFEFGCGRGRILSRLKKDGFEKLSAHDLSEKYRADLSSLVGAQNVFIGERPKLASVDLAFSFFALEHDEHPLDSLRYLKGVLRPGGFLYLMLPNYQTNLVDLACADHVNHFSAELLRELVETLGFEVVSCDVESNMGAVALLARNARPARPWEASPARVRRSQASTLPFLDYARRLVELTQRLTSPRLYLYGAGFYAALTLAHLHAAGRGVDGIFDANPKKQGLTRLGQIVEAPPTEASGMREGTLILCVNERVAQSLRPRFERIFRSVQTV